MIHTSLVEMLLHLVYLFSRVILIICVYTNPIKKREKKLPEADLATPVPVHFFCTCQPDHHVRSYHSNLILF